MGCEPACYVSLANPNDPGRIALMPNDVHAIFCRDASQIEQFQVAVMTVAAALHPSNCNHCISLMDWTAPLSRSRGDVSDPRRIGTKHLSLCNVFLQIIFRKTI
jgi:hypothetical protein